MAQYSKDEKSVRFVGVSVHGQGKEKTFHFHISAGEKGRFIVWADLPKVIGVPLAADYRMIKLPRVMTKLAACDWLLEHRRSIKNFTKPVFDAVIEFLRSKQENMEVGPTFVAARRGRSTARRNGRRSVTSHRKSGGRNTVGKRVAA